MQQRALQKRYYMARQQSSRVDADSVEAVSIYAGCAASAASISPRNVVSVVSSEGAVVYSSSLACCAPCSPRCATVSASLCVLSNVLDSTGSWTASAGGASDIVSKTVLTTRSVLQSLSNRAFPCDRVTMPKKGVLPWYKEIRSEKGGTPPCVSAALPRRFK